MEKIEKIGMFVVPSSADEFIVDILAKIAEKTDEIIDRLNEQPEEETLVESVGRKDNIDLGEEITGWVKLEVEDTPEEIEEVKIDLKVRDDAMVYTKKDLDKAREEGRLEGIKGYSSLLRTSANIIERELSKLKDNK